MKIKLLLNLIVMLGAIEMWAANPSPTTVAEWKLAVSADISELTKLAWAGVTDDATLLPTYQQLNTDLQGLLKLIGGSSTPGSWPLQATLGRIGTFSGRAVQGPVKVTENVINQQSPASVTSLTSISDLYYG